MGSWMDRVMEGWGHEWLGSWMDGVMEGWGHEWIGSWMDDVCSSGNETFQEEKDLELK
jgi:hypothetical protein